MSAPRSARFIGRAPPLVPHRRLTAPRMLPQARPSPVQIDVVGSEAAMKSHLQAAALLAVPETAVLDACLTSETAAGVTTHRSSCHSARAPVSLRVQRRN